MVVSAGQINSKTFSGLNGTVHDFPLSGLRFKKAADLRVVYQPASGAPVTLLPGTHFSTRGKALAGAAILQIGNINLASGTLRVDRRTPARQEHRFSGTAEDSSEDFEAAADDLARAVQDAQSQVFEKADQSALTAETAVRIAADTAEAQARAAGDTAEANARAAADAALQVLVDRAVKVPPLSPQTADQLVTTLLSFGDRFCGSTAIAPTQRLNGTALQEGDLWFYTAGPEIRYWITGQWRSGTLPNASPTAQIASDPVLMTTTGSTVNAYVAGIIGGLGAGDRICTVPSVGTNTGPVTLALDGAAAVALNDIQGRALVPGQTGPVNYPMQVLRRGAALFLLNPHEAAAQLTLAFNADPAAAVQTACAHNQSTRRVTLANHGYQVFHALLMSSQSNPGVKVLRGVTAVIDANTFEINTSLGFAVTDAIIWQQPILVSSGNVHSVAQGSLGGDCYINLHQPINLDTMAVFAAARKAAAAATSHVWARVSAAIVGASNRIDVVTGEDGAAGPVSHVSLEVRG